MTYCATIYAAESIVRTPKPLISLEKRDFAVERPLAWGVE